MKANTKMVTNLIQIHVSDISFQLIESLAIFNFWQVLQ